jgi:hypothetical protein
MDSLLKRAIFFLQTEHFIGINTLMININISIRTTQARKRRGRAIIQDGLRAKE